MGTLSRSLAIAAFIVCASTLPSKAVTVPLSPSIFTNAGGTAFFGNTVTQSFTDNYTFTLSGPGIFSASLQAGNAFSVIDPGPPQVTSGFINNFKISIFHGTPALPGTEIPAPVPMVLGAAQFIALTTPLSAGDYFIRVSGLSITGSTASYGGSISFPAAAPSPVPLPPAMASFMAGLGILGWFGAGRRRKGAEIPTA